MSKVRHMIDAEDPTKVLRVETHDDGRIGITHVASFHGAAARVYARKFLSVWYPPDIRQRDKETADV